MKVGPGEEIPQVAFPVAVGDHPRVRAGGGGLPCPRRAVDPAVAAVLRALPVARVHRERAGQTALRRHRRPGVGGDADASRSPTAGLREALRGLETAVVDRRRVSHGGPCGGAPPSSAGTITVPAAPRLPEVDPAGACHHHIPDRLIPFSAPSGPVWPWHGFPRR